MPASRAHDGGGGSHPAQSSCVRLTESTCTRKEALMVVLLLSFHAPQQWHLASLTGPGFFRAHPELPQSSLFRLSLCASPGPFPGSDLRSPSFSTQPPPTPVDECLRLGSAGQLYRLSVQGTLRVAFHKLAVTLSSEAPKLPVSPG